MREWDPRRLTTEEATPRRFVGGVVAAFAAITSFVAWHHEAWRDEADAWLVVRDIDLARLFDWSRHAGTPTLWYGILAPLARAGLPYESQQVLHLGIAVATVALFLLFAPLARLPKTLTVFSYYFSYEYSVIVRSYALSILLIFAATALWRHRAERPLTLAIILALLCNTNAQGFAVAAAFGVALVTERLFRASAIIGIGAVMAWWQVRTPPDPAREGARHVFNSQAIPWTLGNAFAPTLPTGAGVAVAGLVLLAATIVLHRSRNALIVLWTAIGALLALYSFVWLGGLRHSGFLLIVTIVAIWLGAHEIDQRYASAAALLLNGALLISVFVAARYWIDETRAPFSGAGDMARYIQGNSLEGVDIAAHNLTQCEAVLPYLPLRTRFWYAGLGEVGSYLKWDAAQERALEMPYPVAEERARRHFAGREWLLLFNVEMPDPAAHGFRLLHATAEPFEKTDERYWLYAPIR